MKNRSTRQPAAFSLRDQAMRVLTAVLSDRRTLDEAMDGAAAGETPEGRAWLQDLCSGTLRWKGRIDWIIDSLALKKKPTGWLRKALMLATAQILLQDRVAPAVVVSETVDWIKKTEGPAPANFANALLRKVVATATEWRELPFPPASADQAAWASMPSWMWTRIQASHGEAWARAYALASLQRPVTWVRARRPEWQPAWAERGPLPGSWRISSGGAIGSKEGFREGEFIVQDISSQQLVAEVSAELGGGAAVLDLCAAPGGKAVGLAWNGFRVSATDRDGSRFKLLQDTAQRVSATAAGRLDVISLKEAASRGSTFDLVWVDAPCMGTGIIRRHPDIRWLKSEKDLDSLVGLQTELIAEGWKHVRSGGFLVVSVCSVLEAEGAARVQSALPGIPWVKQWLLAPQDEFGGDGFWACLIRKS